MTRLNTLRPGLTLIEIMSVLVMIGILGSVALPAYQRYIRRSRAAEAVMNIEKMYTGAIGYFGGEQANAAGISAGHQFPPSTAATPAAYPTAQPYSPSPSYWDTPGWNALNFEISDPHRYQYLFVNLSDCDPPGGGGPFFDAGGPFGVPGGPFAGLDDAFLINCEPNTVVICHVSPGNGSETSMRIGESAASGGHENHPADYPGVCAGDTVITDGFYALAAGNNDGDDLYSFFMRGAFLYETPRRIRGIPEVVAISPME